MYTELCKYYTLLYKMLSKRCCLFIIKQKFDFPYFNIICDVLIDIKIIQYVFVFKRANVRDGLNKLFLTISYTF